MDLTSFIIMAVVIAVVIAIVGLISDSAAEKAAETERVSKIPESELTPELEAILQRRQDFLNNFRNKAKGLSDYTGTHVIKDIHCDSCGEEADMILYRKKKKIVDGKPIEKYIYYCSLKECQEFQDIDSSGTNIIFLGGFWK